uniref:Uncharacterized protein n=1 Tax=Physcomitrium patens TaxID=3218 RepID=A0A7I4A0B7_PHYPA
MYARRIKTVIRFSCLWIAEFGGRLYNTPAANEVAIWIDGEHIFERYIGYMVLQYPLLYLHGKDGWNHNIPL